MENYRLNEQGYNQIAAKTEMLDQTKTFSSHWYTSKLNKNLKLVW